MIKAVIFDLDGTLLNRDASIQKFIVEQYERLNKWVGHIPREKYISRFIELDSRGYVWKDKVYQQMVNEFNINKITWEGLLQDYKDEFKYSCVPFPNLIKILDILKSRSIRLGMITNGKGQFRMTNIEALGIKNYFDTILISEWEGIKKPNPKIFKKALSQLNVSANESIYVGDHPLNDIKGAQNIGMKGIWKKDIQWVDVEADYVIDDLKELLPIIDDKLTRSGI
ncbi:L-2-haloalkanoic acid dehalogenase [Pueribacillus theae]|uniref:L-2-haloalkanoic acid dehalogenase n=1 Tax=Pueribacillus theae TaxID=2171751 RepID=A0A2U1K5S1_9BACI|nr:HAD-IA family hydrolase [Pueribacillus theae]PWA12268.1 L-2-haloalkanoic acid dehalogenase [Pueribacillus theae]